MKNVCLLLASLALGSNIALAQQGLHKKADQNYDQLAYNDAIRIYERLASKGYKTQEVLQNLADAYYFNGKLKQANSWYEQLFESDYKGKGDKVISPEYYYRYGQSLKAVENYAKSDSIMGVFASIQGEDSRSKLLLNNLDYLEQITNTSPNYQLNSISINSDYSDYGSFLMDNTLIFTSSRPTPDQKKKGIHLWTNENFTSLYSADLQSDDSFSQPEVYGVSLNSKVNDASAIITKDGQAMYFTRNNSNKKGNRKRNKSKQTLLKIYKATKQEDGTWGQIVDLPFNSKDFNTSHPALSVDENYLFFASDRSGTLGASDLYKVAILPDGSYGEVTNLGEVINTSGRETFPYISKNNLLFFASDGHPGLGGLDVFVAKLDQDGSVIDVVNMGSPINSSMDDFALYMDQSNKKGFVSSNRDNTFKGDNIYRFSEMPCYKQLQGIVTDKQTTKPLAFSQVTLTDENGSVLEVLAADQNGFYSFKAQLDCQGKYFVKAQEKDYNTWETAIVLDGKPTVENVDLALAKNKVDVNLYDDLFKTLGLNPIYFDFDKSYIRKDAALELTKVYNAMIEHPSMKIDVRSHTDSRGNDTYNMSLSDRRVKSTINWLVKQGISADRLTGRGYGESQLINRCSNGVPCSISEHQKNRRSEFKIIEL